MLVFPALISLYDFRNIDLFYLDPFHPLWSCLQEIRLCLRIGHQIAAIGFHDTHDPGIVLGNRRYIAIQPRQGKMRSKYALQFAAITVYRFDSRNRQIIHHKMRVYRRKKWPSLDFCSLIPVAAARVKTGGFHDKVSGGQITVRFVITVFSVRFLIVLVNFNFVLRIATGAKKISVLCTVGKAVHIERRCFDLVGKKQVTALVIRQVDKLALNRQHIVIVDVQGDVDEPVDLSIHPVADVFKDFLRGLLDRPQPIDIDEIAGNAKDDSQQHNKGQNDLVFDRTSRCVH